MRIRSRMLPPGWYPASKTECLREMQGMVAGNPVECVKLGQFAQGYAGFQERTRIELLASQVDVDTPYDTLHELFKLLHSGLNLPSIFLRCVFVL